MDYLERGSEARTSTDQCVDQVNAWAGHKYRGPSTGWNWLEHRGQNSYSSGPCHNNSGISSSGTSLYISGTQHLSHGIHVAYIDGQRHEWDETGPGPQTLPES